MLEKFHKNVKKYKTNDVICINETFLNTSITRQRGRSIIGTRCIIKTTNQEVFKKYTGIFTMSSSKIVNYEIYKQDGINGEQLLKFLQIVLKDKKNKIIILDNASSHKNEKVKKFN